MKENPARRPPSTHTPSPSASDFGTALENFLSVREIFYAICAGKAGIPNENGA